MQRRCRSIPGSTVVGWPLAQLGAGAEWNERNFIQDRNDRAVIIRGVARKWDESCTSKKKRRERLSTEHGYFGERSPVMSVNSRSEEHTSELQSLMRISYAVFCLKQKKKINKKY